MDKIETPIARDNEPEPSNVMPPDRRPTPFRIINPRAVNEEGAEPILSRGDPDEWPARDKDYSNRSYFHFDKNGRSVPDSDAPQGPPEKIGRRNNPEYEEWDNEQYMKDPNRTFHALHLCFSRGPNGPPTYDQAGYQLSYTAVGKWMGVIRVKFSELPSIEEKMKEEEEMMKIFFKEGAAPLEIIKSGRAPTYWHEAWKDRVSKDLGIPKHEINLSHFRTWEERGFRKAEKGEFQNFSPEYIQRLGDLLKGGSLRRRHEEMSPFVAIKNFKPVAPPPQSKTLNMNNKKNSNKRSRR